MADDDKTREAMEVMRGQAAVYGIKVNPKWSPEEFAQAIIDAQVAIEAKANEAFAAAKKVKVRMKRDCWVLTTRVPAGKTADVTVEMAQNWYEAGACEPAEPFGGFAP